MDTHYCPRCKQTRPIDQFHIRKPNGRHKGGKPHTPCKPCRRKTSTPTKDPLLKGHGLRTSEAKLLREGNSCEICNDTAEAVDHEHSTGKIRGVLCHRCNQGIGNFAEDPHLLRLAIKYLEKYASV